MSFHLFLMFYLPNFKKKHFFFFIKMPFDRRQLINDYLSNNNDISRRTERHLIRSSVLENNTIIDNFKIENTNSYYIPHISFKKLGNLIKNNYDDINIPKILCPFFLYITREKTDMVLFHSYVRNLKRLNAKSAFGKVYFVCVDSNQDIDCVENIIMFKTEDMTLYDLDPNLTDMQKNEEKTARINNLRHEFCVGYTVCNSMRKLRVPNFIYTYSIFMSSIPIDVNDKVIYGLPYEEVPTIIIERIPDARSFLEYCKDPDVDNKSIVHKILQVILALQVAYEKYGFVHNDLHCENIIISERPIVGQKIFEYDCFGTKFAIENDGFIPYIIDFGRSQFKTQDDILVINQDGINFLGLDSYINTPVNDIYRMLFHLYLNKLDSGKKVLISDFLSYFIDINFADEISVSRNDVIRQLRYGLPLNSSSPKERNSKYFFDSFKEKYFKYLLIDCYGIQIQNMSCEFIINGVYITYKHLPDLVEYFKINKIEKAHPDHIKIARELIKDYWKTLEDSLKELKILYENSLRMKYDYISHLKEIVPILFNILIIYNKLSYCGKLIKDFKLNTSLKIEINFLTDCNIHLIEVLEKVESFVLDQDFRYEFKKIQTFATNFPPLYRKYRKILLGFNLLLDYPPPNH